MSSGNILIVDDNDPGRYIKARALRNAGFEVAEAATAKEGLEYVDKHQVQVAILDVKLPDMHGFELCRVIKTRHPYVVILQTSATFTSAEDRVAGLEIGADAYLVEPMEDTELVATVRALLRVRQAEAALRATELRFAQFAQASPDVLWIYNVDEGCFEYVSPSFEELFGQAVDVVRKDAQRWFSSVAPEHREALIDMIDRCAPDRETAVEYRIVRPDGTDRWLRDRAFLLPSECDHSARVAGLARDVTESKRAERQRELLISELNHRVKNTLAIVQALVSHTRHASVSPQEFEKAVTARLHALAQAHDLLTQTLWKGTTLQHVIDAALGPFTGGADARSRITSTGPSVWLDANSGVTLTLAFHELATNAAKYGALLNNTGRVSIAWTAEPPGGNPTEISLKWVESGGPPVVSPQRKGFGSTLIERVLTGEAEGHAQLLFHPQGLELQLKLPLSERIRLE